jgi:hypothetical protein
MSNDNGNLVMLRKVHLSIGHRPNIVVIDFGPPGTRIDMRPDDADALAEAIKEAANRAREIKIIRPTQG